MSALSFTQDSGLRISGLRIIGDDRFVAQNGSASDRNRAAYVTTSANDGIAYDCARPYARVASHDRVFYAGALFDVAIAAHHRVDNLRACLHGATGIDAR